jgi:hypothetical protein
MDRFLGSIVSKLRILSLVLLSTIKSNSKLI